MTSSRRPLEGGKPNEKGLDSSILCGNAGLMSGSRLAGPGDGGRHCGPGRANQNTRSGPKYVFIHICSHTKNNGPFRRCHSSDENSEFNIAPNATENRQKPSKLWLIDQIKFYFLSLLIGFPQTRTGCWNWPTFMSLTPY
jgi:hypothetical protein